MISKNICKLAQDNDYVYYRACCQCTDPSHHQDISIELDYPEYRTLTANFYYPVVSEKTSLVGRIKAVFSLIFYGHVEGNGSLLFDEKGLESYIEALNEGLELLKNGRN